MSDEKIFAYFVGSLIMGFTGIIIILGCIQWASGWTKVVSADNVIFNYEWFFDAQSAIDSRTAQIAAEKLIIEAETDKDELRKLRIDIGGMQQSCRDLVGDYNSNATKANRSIFKAKDLPDFINPQVCE